MNVCVFCGSEGKYFSKHTKKWYCGIPNQCPTLRAKNSSGVTKAYKEGRKLDPSTFSAESRYKMGETNRNKTAFTHPERLTNAKFKPNEVFIENSLAANQTIKKILIQERGYKCEGCGIDKWKNEPITLELHHENGNNRDNRRENIKLVCPNCHSQTNQWRGKNINKGTKQISDETIIETFKQEGNVRRTLLRVGLSAGSGNYLRVQKLTSTLSYP